MSLLTSYTPVKILGLGSISIVIECTDRTQKHYALKFTLEHKNNGGQIEAQVHRYLANLPVKPYGYNHCYAITTISNQEARDYLGKLWPLNHKVTKANKLWVFVLDLVPDPFIPAASEKVVKAIIAFGQVGVHPYDVSRANIRMHQGEICLVDYGSYEISPYPLDLKAYAQAKLPYLLS